jgi:hypothetical protein
MTKSPVGAKSVSAPKLKVAVLKTPPSKPRSIHIEPSDNSGLTVNLRHPTDYTRDKSYTFGPGEHDKALNLIHKSFCKGCSGDSKSNGKMSNLAKSVASKFLNRP